MSTTPPPTAPPESAASPPRTRRLSLGLLVACVLYLALRALVLHTSFDAVAIPVYELHARGNLAKVTSIGGGGVPLHDYYDNCGGHIVTGLLAAPVFVLLGDSYLALKLVPLLLGLGVLLLVWRFLDVHVDRRAANLAALLLALAPPTLLKFSLLTFGHHFEKLFFQVLVLVLTYRALGSRRRAPWLVVTGLAAGFAVFFSVSSVILVSLCALVVLLVRGIRGALADLRFALPGFLVGVAPVLWINISSGGRVTDFLTANAPAEEPGRFGNRVAALLTDILPRAGAFEDLGPLPGALAEWTYLAAFATAWLLLLPDTLRSVARVVVSHRAGTEGDRDATPHATRLHAVRLLPLLLYLPLFLLVFGSSSFRFTTYPPPVEVGSYRYLLPHFTWAAVLVAVAASRLVAQGGGRAIAGRVLAGATLGCALFTLPVVDWTFSSTGLGPRYEGYIFRRYPNLTLRHMERDEPTQRFALDRPFVAAMLTDFPRALQLEGWIGVGYVEARNELAWRDPASWRLPLGAILASYPEDVRLEIARGMGSWLRGRLTEGRADEGLHTARLLARLAVDGHPLAPCVAEGLALDQRFTLARLTAEHLELTERLGAVVPPGLRTAWRRGQGIQAGRLLRRGIASDVEAVRVQTASIPPDERAAYDFGVGWGLADRSDTLPSAAEIDAWVDDGPRLELLRGAAAGRREAEPDEELPAAWVDALTPEERDAVLAAHAWPESGTPSGG